MSIIREALAPLAARLVREHDVLHVAADLAPGDDAIQQARTEMLRWAQKRSGGRLPHGAMNGGAFDLLAAGRSTSAVVVDLPQIQAWALRQEDPDKEVAGRIWTSEAIIWRTPERTPEHAPRFAARLIVGSNEAELNIAHAALGYVRQLTENVGLVSGGRPLSSKPWHVGDEEARDELLDLLADPARQLPVVVVSALDRDRPGITLDLDALAAGLCGLAQVVAILPETYWALSDRFGKRLSAYERAARLYLPGFDESADPFSHPLWLGTRMDDPEDFATVDRQIRARVAAFSTRAVRLGTDILPFAQLRSISRQAEQDRLVASGASDVEKLSAAANRIVALTEELGEAESLKDEAVEEALAAQLRAEEAEARERGATARVQVLLQSLVDADARPPETALPTSWTDFEEWSGMHLAGRVALTGAARRGCRKALYANVEQAARCLVWLAQEGRDRFLNGGGSLRDSPVDDGLKNSPCGSDEFTFDWQGHRLTADWHVKNGGNTRDPVNCLRIYYAWDDQTQQIVVADMPGHRHSGVT